MIDGEHAPAVVREALVELPYEWVGAILVGGTEKLRGDADYGVPLVEGFGDAEVVVDLSDEPVLGPAERFRWASRALAAGLPYLGADFRFDPPEFEAIDVPSIAVIGTGKRVGKTAVAAHLARLLRAIADVVVVAMGRGGPPEPELDRAAADDRRPRRALARRSSRGLGPPRDRRALRRADDRLPAGRRRAGRAGLRLRMSPRAPAWPRRAGPTSSSSTEAARRSRRSPPTAECSSSARDTICRRISISTEC